MIKVNKKMVKRFLEIMEDYGEFIFGSEDYLQAQLGMCLNSQGYWSGNSIKVFYNEDKKDFEVRSRF